MQEKDRELQGHLFTKFRARSIPVDCLNFDFNLKKKHNKRFRKTEFEKNLNDKYKKNEEIKPLIIRKRSAKFVATSLPVFYSNLKDIKIEQINQKLKTKIKNEERKAKIIAESKTPGNLEHFVKVWLKNKKELEKPKIEKNQELFAFKPKINKSVLKDFFIPHPVVEKFKLQMEKKKNQRPKKENRIPIPEELKIKKVKKVKQQSLEISKFEDKQIKNDLKKKDNESVNQLNSSQEFTIQNKKKFEVQSFILENQMNAKIEENCINKFDIKKQDEQFENREPFKSFSENMQINNQKPKKEIMGIIKDTKKIRAKMEKNEKEKFQKDKKEFERKVKIEINAQKKKKAKQVFHEFWEMKGGISNYKPFELNKNAKQESTADDFDFNFFKINEFKY